MSFTKSTLPSSFPGGNGVDNAKNGITSAYRSLTFGNSLSLRVDEGVGAMTISPSGRDVALASRSGLYIIDLDDPFSPPRWLHHVTSWEVADVQWSPHASKPSWVISTSNQKALVWNLALPSSQSIEHMLHGHQRAITDINFHGFHPEMLATCSVDSFVHVWDLRDSKKLVQSFADWTAGATQVKWNRRNPNLLASSHDRKVHIWDSRKGSLPLHTLTGHSGKVNGVDFHREEETRLLTCSNDCTVKSWNYGKDDQEAQYTIQTDFPVWRARHTPFGSACVIMPLRGGNNSIYMHDMEYGEGNVKLNSIHTFRGHSEPVKEFVWRARGGNTDIEDREFQLVTWSKDHDLKLWPISDSVLEQAHYKRGTKLLQRITRKGSTYTSFQSEPSESKGSSAQYRPVNMYGLSPEIKKGKNSVFMTGGKSVKPDHNTHLHWISGVRIGRSAFAAPFDNSMGNSASGTAEVAAQYHETTPGNLGEEVSIVGHKFPKVRFEKISVSTGECIVSLNGPWGDSEGDLVFLRVEIKFPSNYPYSAPKFTIEKDDKHEAEKIKSILAGLDDIASRLSGRGKYCLEPSLRYLLGDKISIEDYDTDDDEVTDDKTPSLMDESLEDLNDFSYSSSSDDDELNDHQRTTITRAFDSCPVPKGSGGVWSKTGQLICFFTQKKDSNSNSKHKYSSQLLSGNPGIMGSASLSNSIRLDTGGSESGNESSDSLLDESDSDDSLTGGPLGLGSHWPLEGNRIRRNYRMRAFGPKSAMSNTDRSGTGGGTFRGEKDKNVVQIYDYSHLIPSRKDLATEYRVMGDTPQELAKHNANVALKCGSLDVADCWKLIEMLLTTEVSLPPPLPLGLRKESQGISAFGRFSWGNHPMGNHYLIDQLFDYFRRQNNIQMLANMSCVLSGRTLRTNFYEGRPITTTATVAPNETPVTPKSPFGFDPNRDTYFDTNLNQITPVGNNPLSSLVASSKTAPWDIPGARSGALVSNEQIQQQQSSVSSRDDSSIISLSPEKFMTARKAVAGIFTRSTGQQQQSVKIPKWHTSSVNTKFSGNTPPLTSVSTANEDLGLGFMYNTPSGAATHIASRNSFVGSDAGDMLTNAPKVNVEIVNTQLMDTFSEDLGVFSTEELNVIDPASQHLLDPKKEPVYNSYRWQYAAILYSWGLEIESLEVVKFNFNSKYDQKAEFYEGVHVAGIEFRDPPMRQYGPLEREKSSRRVEYTRMCQYCELAVQTSFVQCPCCEHIVHYDCALDWWDKNGATECASGCGCTCMDL